MNSLFRKMMLGAVVLGMTLNMASAYDFNKKRSVAVFKGFGKYPYMHRVNPFNNEVDLILYGCRDGLVKSAQDYQSLIPVEFTMGLLDNGIKMRKRYSRFNETYTTIVADSTLRLFGLLPEEDYKKDFKDDFLMSEIKKDAAIKIVVPTLEHLDALISYLSEKLEVKSMDIEETEAIVEEITGQEVVAEIVEPTEVTEEAIETIVEETLIEVDAPALPKPLLLIEIENGEELTQSHLDFLNTYFEIANPIDENVNKLYTNADAKIVAAMDNMKDLFLVGQSFGDMIMETIEKDFDKGDAKKLTIRAVKLFALAFTFALAAKLSNDLIITPIYKKMETSPAYKKMASLFKPEEAPKCPLISKIVTA